MSKGNPIRLKEKFEKKVVLEMMKRFNYKNKFAVPKIEKVIINTSFGKLVAGKTKEEQEKIYKEIIEELALITGQKPILTKAKESISGFNIKKGQFIGAKVTLRRKKMYDFLERLINIALPRSKDFKGIDEKSFDKNGILTIGMEEQIAFPEISPERAKFIFGLEITIITNAKKREEAIELLKLMEFPIKIQKYGH